ncbi:MAG: YbjN domain-containing protein [Pikeienuella sp.]
MIIRILIAAALQLAVLSTGAIAGSGDLYRSISPNQLLNILSSERGRIDIDETESDTTLEGRVAGADYSVYFYECDGAGFTDPARPNSECLGFEYRAYFSGFGKDLATVNQWNIDYHYGSLWQDGDDLVLQLNVVVEGGITEENIGITFLWWKAVIDSFYDFMEQN